MQTHSSWLGAYYYKIYTDPKTKGIQATLQLPEFTPDPARWFDYKPTHRNHRAVWWGPLDLIDVYFGVRNPSAPATQRDLDVGLAWSALQNGSGHWIWSNKQLAERDRRVKSNQYFYDETKATLYDSAGAAIATNSSEVEMQIATLNLEPVFAYIPFYRTLENTPSWNAFRHIAYFPGEEVKISLHFEGVRFYLQILAQNHTLQSWYWDQPILLKKPETVRFKRVFSIDQFRVENNKRVVNERVPGKPVSAIPTDAKTGVLQIKETSLLSFATSPTWKYWKKPYCEVVIPSDLAPYSKQIFQASEWNPSGGQNLQIFGR